MSETEPLDIAHKVLAVQSITTEYVRCEKPTNMFQYSFW